MSKALRDLSGSSNLSAERVGHYLATWALSCPLARRQFGNVVQYVNTATSTHTTGAGCLQFSSCTKMVVRPAEASFLTV